MKILIFVVCALWGGAALSEHFHWGAAFDVQEWWLYLGTKKGAKDIWDSKSLGKKLDADREITRDTVHVRLWYKVRNKWHSEDFVYLKGKDLLGYGKKLHLVVTP